MVGVGLVLVSAFFGAGGFRSGSASAAAPGGFSVPSLTAEEEPSGGPEDKTLRLTVPAMNRIEDAEIPSASGEDTEALDSHKAIHLAGTGFPWEDGSNVYIAGHRLGYPASESFLAFYDLTELRDGDEVFVTDSEGTRYTYRVFNEFTVSPSDLSVTEPIPDKKILTLQTCTLPDYSQRLIVQAELVDTQQSGEQDAGDQQA